MESVNLNQILYGAIQKSMDMGTKGRDEYLVDSIAMNMATKAIDEHLKEKVATLSPQEQNKRKERVEFLNLLYKKNGLKYYASPNGDVVDDVTGK